MNDNVFSMSKRLLYFCGYTTVVLVVRMIEYRCYNFLQCLLWQFLPHPQPQSPPVPRVVLMTRRSTYTSATATMASTMIVWMMLDVSMLF